MEHRPGRLNLISIWVRSMKTRTATAHWILKTINNNNILDFDPSKNSSEDTGWEFNPPGLLPPQNNLLPTRIGSGPGLNSFTSGDGILNTEDLNHNGILDTNEAVLKMPSTLTSPFNDTTPLSVSMNNSTWQSAKIYLNKASADYTSNPAYFEELLKKVQSIRFYLKNSTLSPATTGTIYIDSIKFVSTIWGNLVPANVT